MEAGEFKTVTVKKTIMLVLLVYTKRADRLSVTGSNQRVCVEGWGVGGGGFTTELLVSRPANTMKIYVEKYFKPTSRWSGREVIKF